MPVQLKNAELEDFVEAQVKAGRFPSPEAVVEAAVAQMRLELETDELTNEDIKAIEDAEAQISRGDGIELSEFAAAMRKKYCSD